MIKQIQLRGISRTPSDRLTEDGGLSESLNMYLDSAESAPVLVPKDVTSDLGLPSSLQAKELFIHKTIYGDNVIAVDNSSKVLFDGSILLSNVGEVKDITSLGNTLVIATTENVYYFLYRHSSKSYTTLGNTIPFPTVEITAKHIIEKSGVFNVITRQTTDQPSLELMFGSEWNDPKNTYNILMTNQLNTRYSEVSLFSSRFNQAILVRYGIKLYDGSYITSIPYLVSPENISGFSNVKAEYNFDEGYDSSDKPLNIESVDVTYTIRSYKPTCKLLDFNKNDIANWKDIIQSIDIFFSTQIPRKLDSIRVNNVVKEYDFASADITFPTEYDEEQIISKSDFRLVGSYAFDKEDDINALLEGVTFEPTNDTDLINNNVALDPLKEKMNSEYIVPRKLTTFNSRLVACDVIKQVTSGSKTFMSASGTNHNSTQWTIRYFINETMGDCEVLARNVDGHPYLTAEVPYGWICYPNPNCTQVVISQGSKSIRVAMKAHPWLNCSYAYLGQMPLATYLSEDAAEAETNRTQPESAGLDEPNKLYVTSSDNPFTFPISGIHSFDNKIVGVAISSAPLSQGQFGQYPLYVFTEDGIWAMETGADGSFVTSKPLSREVCTNPDSITSIDNAVVFVTKKGAMLIQGADVVNLSTYMNGKHYSPNENAIDLIEQQDEYANLVDVIGDEDSFISFMQDAKVAYDYAGQRLIFMSSNNDVFQYVYKVDTQTWHKMSISKQIVAPINSYPECLIMGHTYVLHTFWKPSSPYGSMDFDEVEDYLVENIPNFSRDDAYNFLIDARPIDVTEIDASILKTVRDDLEYYWHIDIISFEDNVGYARVYDLSTILSPDISQETAKGVLITRPFDLGEPDVYKTLKAIKIRGEYDKGNVKYFVQGSDDGKTFYNLTSLRGKSWKMFRLFILADLEPTERISWVDIEYDSRFKNRLR